MNEGDGIHIETHWDIQRQELRFMKWTPCCKLTLKSFVYRLLIGIYHKSVTSHNEEQTTHSCMAFNNKNESFVLSRRYINDKYGNFSILKYINNNLEFAFKYQEI